MFKYTHCHIRIAELILFHPSSSDIIIFISTYVYDYTCVLACQLAVRQVSGRVADMLQYAILNGSLTKHISNQTDARHTCLIDIWNFYPRPRYLHFFILKFP